MVRSCEPYWSSVADIAGLTDISRIYKFTADAHFLQETMNYWKQLNHVMKHFRAEEDPKAHLPQNFISGFLEVGSLSL